MNTKLQQSLVALTILCELVTTSMQSIVGITYKDELNFKERYSNTLECDPMYWHPLHMPDHCATTFEKMIRNRLWDLDKQALSGQMEKNIRNYKKLIKGEEIQYSDENPSYDEYYSENSFPFSPLARGLDYIGTQDEVHVPFDFLRPAAPYEKMLQMLTRDVMRLPAQPVVGLVPYIGLAAIYRQPVSQNTIDVIKKIGRKYADVADQTGVIWRPESKPADCNTTQTINKETDISDEVDKKIYVIEDIIENIKKVIDKTDLSETDENGLTHKKLKVGSAELEFKWKKPKH